MTSAPKSAMMVVDTGPAMKLAASITRIPSSRRAMIGSPRWTGGGSAGKDGDGGDLDDGALAQQARHDHARRGRVGRPEELPPHLGCPPVLLRGCDVFGRLDDVLHASASRLEEALELAEDDPRLLDDVAGRDELAMVVRGRGARDEEEVAGPHSGRERVACGPGRRTDDRLERGHDGS